MQLILVLNRGAGTLSGLDADAAAEELAAVFRANGHAVTAHVHEGGDALAAVERACGDKDVEGVIVGGGDGTVSSAAAIAAKSGKALGILPLGTMNLFARSLGIPLEMKAAAEALAQGRVEAVDICEANDRLFVHHVALGLHAAVLRVRERLDYGSRWGKIRASFQAWWIVVRRPPRLDVELRFGGSSVRRRTAAVLISNNPLGEGHLPYADDPTEGALGLYVVKSRRLPDLVRLAIALAVGAVARSPHLEKWQAKAVEIASPAATLRASVDGEVVPLATPLRCRSLHGGLRVIRPAPA